MTAVISCVASLLLLVPLYASAQDGSAHSDSYWYGRFGYGTIGGESRFGGPAVGFGHRFERDAVALDILLGSAQMKILGTSPDLHEVGGVYTHAFAASVLTTKALYLLRPRARMTPYVGAGAGWGAVSFGRTVAIDERWHGKGLQGELAVGYAFARSNASTRFFLEADFTRPFYSAERFSDRITVHGDRLATSLVASLGAGW